MGQKSGQRQSEKFSCVMPVETVYRKFYGSLFMVRLRTKAAIFSINRSDCRLFRRREHSAKLQPGYSSAPEGYMDNVQEETTRKNKQETACRTVHQYNKEPIPGEDMKKLREIAEDYRRVKNYVYARYGGIGSLSKLYPGYTVQNEMTASGLRSELGLPSVYFYRAVFDALGDIKSQWAATKTKLAKLVGQNENFTAQEKHYLRFLLKSSNAFEAILNQKAIQLPQEMQRKYEELSHEVNTEKLHRYLCRQVRKYHQRELVTNRADGFYLTERAYRYGVDQADDAGRKPKYGIFIATKEKRRRVFIPLTDENSYQKQIYLKLIPEESGVDISIPLAIKVRMHRDYTNEIGLSAGMRCMFTTQDGTVYGEQFWEIQEELAQYLRASAETYRREKANNAGRRKYRAQKARLDAKLETYINQEINRMIEQEKPKVIYLPKLPGNSRAGYDRRVNYSVGVWRKGLIRERLEQKCLEHSIALVEVFGKAISSECSNCGSMGKYSGNDFRCGNCGFEADKKQNAARNALKRGQAGNYVNKIMESDEKAGTK